MLNIPRVAQYARFSSDNQRSESIDAQIRAMNLFCKQNHWQVVSTYTDEAKSGLSPKKWTQEKCEKSNQSYRFESAGIEKQTED